MQIKAWMGSTEDQLQTTIRGHYTPAQNFEEKKKIKIIFNETGRIHLKLP